MHDGQTRRVESIEPERATPFLEEHRATLTITRGPAAGTEYSLDQARIIIGRSGDTQIQIDDASISSEHAAIELDSQGFGIRDLASTNHVQLNGADILASDLKHGDRIQLGQCELQYVVEKRPTQAKTWSVEEND